ncbi:MAG: glycosyltransferase family 2 protein [Flavobacteriaceae bacterium]|jgi:glycosyltransferase involved in cell wall biosynthesis|nr:glycosyltransferase family 2 protein [Flavobacteriaceae bacterium]MDP4675087.1 glycosyltransferase family 2 protein [Flavobacteriaceae bacterium]MDP4754963.1 glycosyltransferase family 2 protein [Flavobacteriaceae bacterium]MDP4884996.1 glycosyltransferase family 2 protein [Flavobacteriaceae bacterium]MDP4971528.1 glycosyltransferase family 2 protein [Flavobacteriaceae bacterium]
MELSVVIPLFNEEESLPELVAWIDRALALWAGNYEVILIDDGSSDGSWSVIEVLIQQYPQLKAIRFSKNYGKSQALHAGFARAQGKVVVTMDADLQDSPEEIPGLYQKITEEGYDLVSGWKRKRFDSFWGKNLPSKLFNWAARKTSGIKLNDFNCGLKAYRLEAVKAIEVSGEMHRYLPVLVKNAGFSRIAEQVVQHQSRRYGTTKFGASRFINGFLDLLTIWFLSTFGKRPMHLFGAVGVLLFILGFVFSLYLGIDKIWFNPQGRLITQRPEFFIALACMVLGTQFFLAGFLGEIIIRQRKTQVHYRIQATIPSQS